MVQRSLEEPFTNKHNLGGFLLSNSRPALINQNYMLPSPGIGKQKLVWVTQLQDTRKNCSCSSPTPKMVKLLIPLHGFLIKFSKITIYKRNYSRAKKLELRRCYEKLAISSK